MAWWRLATEGSPEAQEEFVLAGKAYNNVFADESEQRRVEGWYRDRGSLESSVLRRQVEVLRAMFAERRGDGKVLARIDELEAEANAAYGNYRAPVRGRGLQDSEVREILRSSDDVGLRRETWEASKAVGREVEGIVRELARLRNRLAREQGYENHYERALDLQDIEAGELSLLMDELETVTAAPFAGIKAGVDREVEEKFGVEAVMPWHLTGPFFQRASDVAGIDLDRFFEDRDIEDLVRETFDALGLDVRSVIARSDLYEREGKSQHAFCLRVGRQYPYDVRVLANVQPNAMWADAMLHEFGHAVYDANVNPGLPYLLRGISHFCTTEAIALMMGSLIEDSGWLRSVAGIPSEELDPDGLANLRQASKLILTRSILVMYHFEQALYEDPEREDLNSVWWDLVERLMLVDRPPDRDEPDWAAIVHVAAAPVYYHNYMLGELIAAQLRAYLETNITHGPFYENEVAGGYLAQSIFNPGARQNWRDTVIDATGEPLDLAPFVRSIS